MPSSPDAKIKSAMFPSNATSDDKVRCVWSTAAVEISLCRTVRYVRKNVAAIATAATAIQTRTERKPCVTRVVRVSSWKFALARDAWSSTVGSNAAPRWRAWMRSVAVRQSDIAFVRFNAEKMRLHECVQSGNAHRRFDPIQTLDLFHPQWHAGALQDPLGDEMLMTSFERRCCAVNVDPASSEPVPTLKVHGVPRLVST